MAYHPNKFKWLKLAIRTFGFILLLGVTLKDFLPLVFEYKNNNLATQIEVVILDRNFQAPQLVLEITPIDFLLGESHSSLIDLAKNLYSNDGIDCALCQELEAHSDLSQYKKYGFEVFYEALSLAFAEKLLTTPGNTTFSPWNQPILAAAINFFHWQDSIDYDLKFPPKFPAQVQSEFSANHERFLVNIDAIFAQVWKAACQNLIISEYTGSDNLIHLIPDNTTCADLIHISSIPITFLDGMTLPLPPIDLPKPKTYHLIFTNTSFLQKDEPPAHVYIYAEGSDQYANALNPLVASYLSEIVTDTPGQSHSVSIKYSVQMRAVETRPKIPCHNESSPSICIKKCALIWLVDQCGCVPFSMKEGLGKNFWFKFPAKSA